MSREPMASTGWLSHGTGPRPALPRAELTTPWSSSSSLQMRALPAMGVTTGMKKMTRSRRDQKSDRCWSQ